MKEEPEKWYTRSVFSVKDMQRTLQYYCDLLGFEQSWKYDEEGRTIVTQVEKGEFELIVTENLDRIGQARVFVSLTKSELNQFEKTINNNEVHHDRIYWGYPCIRIQDPDGNELLFPLEDEV